MFAHAYLRSDGQFDLYTVEPVTITAAEYEALQKREKLEARQKELRESRVKIDEELATVTSQLAALPKLHIESNGVLNGTATSNESSTKARRW